ncbi:hypothetical protein HY612_00175, partial [Candidatus Roizmanbacteria bacterium]|nr:hypothetical protein [Candidatus Roizmanbacteria bacterium]
YQHKAVFLDKKYNFMISSVKEGFNLKEGVFYQKNGEKIAVVRNAGRSGFLRPINNFGYGRQFNRIKYIVYILKKIFYTNASKLKNIAKLRLQG